MIGDMESTLLIDAAYRANFDLPQIPEPDGSYVLNQKLWYVYKEKARESVPVTRPALQGLRIAQSSLNEQRRSPRRYVQLEYLFDQQRWNKNINISRRHLLLLCLWQG